MKIDIAFTGELSEVGERVRALQGAGFDGVLSRESGRDIFYPLVLAAEHSTLDIYTNVAIALPRSPMHLAYQAYDLHRFSEGRFALGLGSQIRPHIQKRYSALWDKPVKQMREIVESLQAIYRTFHDGDRLDFQGDYYSFSLMTPVFNPGPLPWGPPPIWLAALGPNMTAMAAEVADAVLIHPFNTRRFLDETTLPNMARGRARADRADDDVDLVIDTIVAVYRDEREEATAIQGARGNLAFYGSTPAYRVTLDAHGWGDMQTELNRLTKEGRWGEMGEVIDDEVLRTIAVVGTPRECAAQIKERYGDLASRLSISAPYQTSDDLLAELIDEIRGSSQPRNS